MNPQPTRFAELVSQASSVLDDNFHGAYLMGEADILVVTKTHIDDDAVRALVWPEQLKVSYVPAEALSMTVRWVLHEHGVTLAGPPADTIVDPVAPEDLLSETRARMRELTAQLKADPGALGRQWQQPEIVLSYCHMLNTLATGRVQSQRIGGAWARDMLDLRFSDLIQQALSGQAGSDALTWEFVDYAMSFV